MIGPEPHLVRLEPGDNWGVLRERLRWAGGPVGGKPPQGPPARPEAAASGWPVLLVLAEGQKVVGKLVHFRLLRRDAARAGLRLAVVTPRYSLRGLARTAGLESFRSVDEAKARLVRAPAKAKGVALSLPSARAFRQRQEPSAIGSALGTILAVTLVALALLGLVLPEATVTLSPASRPLTVQAVLDVRPGAREVDVEQFLIPGQKRTVTVEGTAQAVTVSARDAPDARATGQATFINKRDVPVTVPQGTAVRTSAGAIVRFVTLAPVELPGEVGARVTAPIQAVDPGPAGNVGPLTINQIEGPLGLNLLVINEAPTEGGSARSVRVVTAEDQNRLRQTLLPRLEQEARSGLERSLTKGEILVEAALRTQTVAETFSHAPNQPADSLSLSMRLRAEGLVLRGDDVEAWALAYLEEEVPAEHVLDPDSLEVTVLSTRAVSPEQAQLELEVKALAQPLLSPDRVRGLVRGLPPELAVERLQQALQLEAPPEVRLAQAWNGRLPYLPFRITVLTSGPSG